MSKSPKELNDLNDNVLSYIFTFFKPTEQRILTTVCQRWNGIINEKFVGLRTYEEMKILDINKAQKPSTYFKSSNLRLERNRDAFFEKLSELPYWFGDITREQGENILLNRELPMKSCLLRMSSIKGCISLSYLKVQPKNGHENFAEINENCWGAILLSNNKKLKVTVNVPTTPVKMKNDKLTVAHLNFVVQEDEDKVIRIRINDKKSDDCYNSIEEFDHACRSAFKPLDREENNKLAFVK